MAETWPGGGDSVWSGPKTDDLQTQKQRINLCTHTHTSFYRIQDRITHCRCSHAEPPCALSLGCQRVSNAARQATTGACVPAGGPEEGRRAAVCAFCVSRDSSETKPTKKKDKSLSVSQLLLHCTGFTE